MKRYLFSLFCYLLIAAASALFVAALTGCTGVIDPAPLPMPMAPKYNAHGRVLVIVAPSEWRSTLAGYIQSKRNEGFVVILLAAEDEQTQLADDLAKLHPAFVFLVGDATLIPTVYRCSDISSWSMAYAKACTYSDSWLSDAIVGRLLTHDIGQVTSYVLKAAAYRAHTASRRAYLVSDRAYEPNDDTVLAMAKRLSTAKVVPKIDVVNYSVSPFTADGAGEADANTVTGAIDQDVDLITYFGHGATEAWGYRLNINRLGIVPAPGTVMPLVMAMGCETARSAPNPPWYPYVDVNGNYQTISPGPPTVPASAIPDPANIQPWYLVDNSMGTRFTSELEAGSMVYIGETVVTSPEYDLLVGFYDGVARAYSVPTTIGDIWAAAAAQGVPEIWQLVGDPSTWFIN